MIIESNRKIYQGEHLTKSDFIRGVGFDNDLLSILFRSKERKKEEYWNKDGIGIDGSIREKKFHPLLDKVLIDNREDCENRRLIIEYVGKHWHFGSYWTILYRIDGTKSHGSLDFKNVSCIDSTVIESIEETLKFVSFEDKKLNWNLF